MSQHPLLDRPWKWAWLGAILTGCFATLVGVCADVDPLILLGRVAITSLGVGGLALAGAWVLTRGLR